MIEIFSNDKNFRLGSRYLSNLKSQHKEEVVMESFRLFVLTHWLAVERLFIGVVLAFVLVLLSFFSGCSGSGITRSTLTRVSEISAVPPVMQGEMKAEKKDSAVVGYSIKNEGTARADTVVRVVYREREKKIFYNVKPDTVKILKVDTLQKFTGYSENDMEVEYTSGLKLGFFLTVLITALVLIYQKFIVKKIS